MFDVEGFILVGGASRRMGRDKARLPLDGRTFVERINDALSAVAARRSVVGATTTEADGWRLPFVPDVYAGCGALGGLHAALAASRAAWALVVACDLPLVSVRLFQELIVQRGNFDAVAPVQSDAGPQPLCALYRVETCLPVAARLLSAGERRARRLLDCVNTRLLTLGEFNAEANAVLMNVNTPDDYESAKNALNATTANTD